METYEVVFVRRNHPIGRYGFAFVFGLQALSLLAQGSAWGVMFMLFAVLLVAPRWLAFGLGWMLAGAGELLRDMRRSRRRLKMWPR